MENDMKFIDLHTHSLCSDGSMTPKEVVRTAKEAGLTAIALSDHDTTAGIREAVSEGEELGVEVIPAIELSAESKTETHILGYFIDPENEEMKKAMEYVKEVRNERQRKVAENLNKLGFDVTIEEVKAIAGSDVLCRAHFARIMVDKGYVSSVKEAFDKYLGSDGPAYCNRQALTDSEAIRLIKNAGGIAFLAHPHKTKLKGDELKEFLVRLKGEGLDGLEGYYTEYTPEMEAEFRGLADELGLLISGGTDFHANNKPHIKIGVGYGNLRIPYGILLKMKEYSKK